MRGATKNGVQTLRAEGEFQPTRPLRGATVKIPVTRWEDGISTHAPLAGRDLTDLGQQSSNSNFNPRAPCGARQAGGEETKVFYQHFNPRAPCGARQIAFLIHVTVVTFQPTRPLRGATKSPKGSAAGAGFQPTRPLRGATDYCTLCSRKYKFQPTRPLRGATFTPYNFMIVPAGFQPTRPLRGATDSFALKLTTSYISTHAPLAGRDCRWHGWTIIQLISTHAPLAGRDFLRLSAYSLGSVFQPTRPLRGATCLDAVTIHSKAISTHAPLAGRDQVTVVTKTRTTNFNPRAPCGARLSFPWLNITIVYFNPRAPCGARLFGCHFCFC